MKLYYSPGACSQAPHILLHEIGLDHDAARVDLKSKTLEDGSSYLTINPKGAVPALELDNGEVLTENAVILQFLGDRAEFGRGSSAARAFPPLPGARMVNFITTELHKSFASLFKPDAADETKRFCPRADRPASSTMSTSSSGRARSCAVTSSPSRTPICS